MIFPRSIACALALSVLFGAGVAAQEPSGRLVIVTSFPEPMFKRLKEAFEQRHPAVKVYIRAKKTSAAISFIEERVDEAADAAKLVAEARALVSKVPVTEATAGTKEFNAIFKKKRKKATDKVSGRQAEVEQKWDTEVKANYAKAKELAEKAQSML